MNNSDGRLNPFPAISLLAQLINMHHVRGLPPIRAIVMGTYMYELLRIDAHNMQMPHAFLDIDGETQRLFGYPVELQAGLDGASRGTSGDTFMYLDYEPESIE